MESFTHPEDAVNKLAESLAVVGIEMAEPVLGRVLAEPVIADRDSPAADVSAMDGYAIRVSDLRCPAIEVAGESQPGQAPATLLPGTALRIVTGAVIPHGTEAVVIREHTDESSGDQVTWLESARATTSGANIRVRGENGKAGDVILPEGTLLKASSVAAAANFGAWRVGLRRRVRVTIIVTGNELLDAKSSPAAWQIRDSNGPTIAAVCATRAWIECMPPTRCIDDWDQLKQQLKQSLDQSDAIILTGGVSKGDYDHVPDVIANLGAQIVFHRLPIRPGRPILGAVSKAGQLILGLPGNPVSAIVCMTQFGIPLLAKQSGQTDWRQPTSSVLATGPTEPSLPLHWYRLVRTMDAATVEILDTRGSGDLVALARSDGFIHQPPGKVGSGPWNFKAW